MSFDTAGIRRDMATHQGKPMAYNRLWVWLADALDEIDRLTASVPPTVRYACGCMATGPLTLPDYCPEHAVRAIESEEKR